MYCVTDIINNNLTVFYKHNWLNLSEDNQTMCSLVVTKTVKWGMNYIDSWFKDKQ